MRAEEARKISDKNKAINDDIRLKRVLKQVLSEIKFADSQGSNSILISPMEEIAIPSLKELGYKVEDIRVLGMWNFQSYRVSW